MARDLVRHNTSGEYFIVETDDTTGDVLAQSSVLHWAEWQQSDSDALRVGLDLYDCDLESVEPPYPGYREWHFVATQDAPDAPVRDLR